MRLLLVEGKTIREIAREKKVWPKRVKEWVDQLAAANLWTSETQEAYPRVITEDEEEPLESYKPPITLARVSIQQRLFTAEDQRDAKMYLSCVSYLEHKKKKEAAIV